MIKQVDVIVVTYNRLKYLKTFVRMLKLSTNYPHRIIVVDNGSTDGTREWLSEMVDSGKIWKHVFNDKNMKLAAAFTEGFKHVESDLFITVADDMIPPIFDGYDWLSVFVHKMKSDESIGCINFVGSRQDFNSFKRKYLPKIYERLSKR